MVKVNRPKMGIDVLVAYVILVIVIITTYILGSYVAERIKTSESQISELKEKPSLYPDYDAIKGSNRDLNINVANLTADCPKDVCLNEKPARINFDGIKRKYLVKGKFSRAYLYIEAAVDYKRPLTSWDDFFFMFENYNWGGHLLTDENLLPVPPGDISKYLYNLKSVSYFVIGKGGNKTTFRNINFFALLQNGIPFDARATVSSDRPGRVLKEVSIYYQCLENSECSIEEVK